MIDFINQTLKEGRMLFTKEEEKNGKVFILVSGKKPENAFHCNVEIVHCVFSRLMMRKPKIQVLKTAVVSFDLKTGKIWGGCCLGGHNVEAEWDLTDFIHTHMYVGRILKSQGLSDKQLDYEYNCTDKTRFAMDRDGLNEKTIIQRCLSVFLK